jgi:hypothetical protein
MIALRKSGGSLAPDPVGEFYAWLTGGFVSVRDVGFGFPLFFALLIEVVSAFGPVTIAAYAEASGRAAEKRAVLDGGPELAMAGHDQLERAMAGQSEPDGMVVLWVAERATPAGETSAIGIAQLHADFVEWCAERGDEAMSPARFEGEFDRVRSLPDLDGKIRKFGNRYYGIGLARKRLRAIGARRNR